MNKTTVILSALSAFALSAAVGCGSKQKAATGPSASQAGNTRVATKQADPVGSRAVNEGGATVASFEPIYFDFDSDALRPEARTQLEKTARYLKATPAARMQIEGHTDERGTTEYNIALGERRAKAARDYIVRLGVEAARIEVTSFGKERPAVRGSSEDAWARNRRGELVPRQSAR